MRRNGEGSKTFRKNRGRYLWTARNEPKFQKGNT